MLFVFPYLDEVGTTYYIVEFPESHLRKILTHFLCKESEIVHDILVMSAEMLTQFWILSGYTHRTHVGVTLAHHHATKHNEHRRTESELVGTEQRHTDDVASGLQLTVGLQTNLSAQSVEDERLLCLTDTYLGRDTGISH